MGQHRRKRRTGGRSNAPRPSRPSTPTNKSTNKSTKHKPAGDAETKRPDAGGVAATNARPDGAARADGEVWRKDRPQPRQVPDNPLTTNGGLEVFRQMLGFNRPSRGNHTTEDMIRRVAGLTEAVMPLVRFLGRIALAAWALLLAALVVIALITGSAWPLFALGGPVVFGLPALLRWLRGRRPPR